MSNPAVVVDLNVLRDKSVIEACLAQFQRCGEQVAFPEMALFELTKHPTAWESTVKRSLQYLAECPDAVVVTRSSMPIGLAEEAAGIPARSVVAPMLTEAFRNLLHDLHKGQGPDLDLFTHAVARFRGRFEHEKHSTDSLQVMQTLKRLGQSTFPREAAARISNDLSRGDRASFRELLGAILRIDQQRDAHVRRGVPPEIADALLDAPAVTYLFALAVGAIGLEWLFKGGVEGASPKRVANDILDIEYMLAGIWIGRLVSEDAGVRDRFDDLKIIGASAWPTHAGWFNRAKVFSPEEALSSFLAIH